jgi:D-serine deaminase-like pyridoxal phosphate-dependent protein
VTEVFAQIQRPTLILDEELARGNIERMVAKAKESGVRFRPHFKTHQSAGVGEWFRQAGVSALTVSSIDMASYFAAHGWDDITIAFPVNIRQMDALNDLAEKVNLHLLVESTETARRLNASLRFSANAWLKVDSGYGRTGIRWDDHQSLVELAQTIGSDRGGPLRLAGLLTHAGHTYGAGSPEKVVDIFNESVTRMASARAGLAHLGRGLELSVGDTPGCSLAPTFDGVDEVRPGNFVFYDLAQLSFGACTEEEIAVALACPVVAKHEARNQIVIHGGAVHLSLDRIPGRDNRPLFGGVALARSDKWSPMFKDSYVRSLSQEHGVVQAEAALFDQVDIGGLLLVIPVHSCLTADLMSYYVTLSGTKIDMAPRPGR